MPTMLMTKDTMTSPVKTPARHCGVRTSMAMMNGQTM